MDEKIDIMRKYVLKIGGKDGQRADQMHEFVKKILIKEDIPFAEIVYEEEEDQYGDTYQDCLYQEAETLMVLEKFRSTAMLQRKLRIGYVRAAMLMDMLEDRGVVEEAEDAPGMKLKGWYATDEAKKEFRKPPEKREGVLDRLIRQKKEAEKKKKRKKKN